MGMCRPVEPMAGPTTAISYGAPYVSPLSTTTTTMGPPIKYQAAPVTTYTPSTSYDVGGATTEMPVPTTITYVSPYQVASVAAPSVTYSGSRSVPPVVAAPSPITYTSMATAPATYVSGTTEIRGGSVSVAPPVYTTVTYAAPATSMGGGSVSMPMGGGSISMQPRGASVNVMPGGGVEIAPAVKYIGSSVSFPAAPAPVQRLVSSPVVTAPVLTAPPVTVATVPPVTTVTAPPVTTATIMAPLPTKMYTAPTTTTYMGNQQSGLVHTISNAAFETMDQNHDGVITRAEFNNAMGMARHPAWCT